MVGLCCDWLKCVATSNHCMWSGELLTLKVVYILWNVPIIIYTFYLTDIIYCVIKTLLPLSGWKVGSKLNYYYISCLSDSCQNTENRLTYYVLPYRTFVQWKK